MKRVALFMSFVLGVATVILFVTTYQRAAAMPDGDAKAGRQVHVANCQRCHGPQGQGNFPQEQVCLGVADELPEGLEGLVSQVRRQVPRLPLAVGFGIATPEQAREVAILADGVVVGSAVVAAMEEAEAAGRDPVDAAATLVRSLAAAMPKG